MSDAASIHNGSADGGASERKGTLGATAPAYAGHRQWFPEKNHLCFPPRGPNRPSLRQVLSEPEIGYWSHIQEPTPEFGIAGLRSNSRAEFLGHIELDAKAQQKLLATHHQGLEDIFAELDQGKAKLARRHKREAEARRNAQRMEADQQRQLESESVGHERAAWALTDKAALDYFNNPIELLDKDISRTNCKINGLQGIFDVKDDFFRPAHPDFNVHGGWNNFKTNERNGELDYFGDPKFADLRVKVKGGPDRPAKLGPSEQMFRERLENKMRIITDLNHKDALAKTDGALRAKSIRENKPEFSALKRDKPPWSDSKDPKLGYFSTPDAYVPGDHPYTTGMPKYVRMSDRALSPKRDYVAGNAERTSFWKAPKPGHQAGSSNYQAYAQEMLCSPGVKGMLKWSGSKSNPAIDLNKVPCQLKKSVSGHLLKGSGGGSPCHKAVGAPRNTGSWKPGPKVGGGF